MSGVNSRHLFTARMQTRSHLVGPVPMGFSRRVGILSGGTFEGERLNGRVLPGGGDWLIQRPDGAVHLDVRCVLETSEDELIYMTYTGRRRTSSDVDLRLLRGEAIAADEMYFRTAIQFEASAERLLWLNDIVAIGIGSRPAAGPTYQVFEIL